MSWGVTARRPIADLDNDAGHVVCQRVDGREVLHGPMEGVHYPGSGLFTMSQYGLDRPIDAEVVPAGIGGLEDAVGQEQDDIAGLECHRLRLRKDGFVEDAEGRARAGESASDLAVWAQDQASGVAGVGVD